MRQSLALTCVFLGALHGLAIEKEDLEDEVVKTSYGLGANYGRSLAGSPLEFDIESFIEGVRHGVAGSSLLSEEEIRTVMSLVTTKVREAQERKRSELAEKNRSEGAAFLAANKEQEGVVVLPSGLQYRILEEGTGTSPNPVDQVEVHYEGTLIDGTVFDSSRKRGSPATFAVTRVIKGWTEALLLMKEGARWELYIPAALAYGPRGSGSQIGPEATLIFDVELLKVKAAAAPSPPARISPPASSDIVRVPSREEMERGEKIEVIPADKVEEFRQKLIEEEKARKEEESAGEDQPESGPAPEQDGAGEEEGSGEEGEDSGSGS